MLATIASLSDEGLGDAREHYATLLEARPKLDVLDDATIARTKRINGEGLEWCDVYDRQLARRARSSASSLRAITSWAWSSCWDRAGGPDEPGGWRRWRRSSGRRTRAFDAS